jgi:hypothetical protein
VIVAVLDLAVDDDRRLGAVQAAFGIGDGLEGGQPKLDQL